MPVVETSVLATAIPAGLNFIVKGAQTGFEIQQVPKESQELFSTISAVRIDILKAKEKRLTLAKICDSDDIAELDRSIREVESALSSLEKLVEPARLDMQHNKGKVKTKTKLMWVVRDSKSLLATNDRLQINYNRMNGVLSRLLTTQPQQKIEKHTNNDLDDEPPPPYQEATMKAIAERRKEENDQISRPMSLNDIPALPAAPSTKRESRYGVANSYETVSNLGPRSDRPLSVPLNRMQDNAQAAHPAPRRTATTSAVHLASDSPRYHKESVDRPSYKVPVPQQPVHTRSSSLPQLNNISTMPRHSFYTPTIVESPESPTSLDSPIDRPAYPPAPTYNGSQAPISPKRPNHDELFIPGTMATAATMGPAHAHKPTMPTRTDGPSSRGPQPPQEYFMSGALGPAQNKRHSVPRSRVIPPYPVSRETSVRARPPAPIPEGNETRSAPAPAPSSYPAPTQPATSLAPTPSQRRKHISSVHIKSPPELPESTIPNNVVNTQRAFAGHRGPVDIRYGPYSEEPPVRATGSQPLPSPSAPNGPPMTVDRWNRGGLDYWLHRRKEEPENGAPPSLGGHTYQPYRPQ